MNDPTFRLHQLRRDIHRLEAARATVPDGPAARSLDKLIDGKRASLEKLEQVAEDLTRLTARETGAPRRE